MTWLCRSLCECEVGFGSALEPWFCYPAQDFELRAIGASIDETERCSHGGHQNAKESLQLAHAKPLQEQQDESVGACACNIGGSGYMRKEVKGAAMARQSAGSDTQNAEVFL